MKNLILIIFFISFSCGYPDIDTVPNFNNVIITDEEAIDLCKLSNTDKKELSKCLDDLIPQDVN
tara:strand:+ start:459 stop:650 length:192 start_codon:yes stop_codon:yes gene_type:complete